jgi:hypothetical protein
VPQAFENEGKYDYHTRNVRRSTFGVHPIDGKRGLVRLFGDTVTYLAKIAVKRLLPQPEYVTFIRNVSTKL